MKHILVLALIAIFGSVIHAAPVHFGRMFKIPLDASQIQVKSIEVVTAQVDAVTRAIPGCLPDYENSIPCLETVQKGEKILRATITYNSKTLNRPTLDGTGNMQIITHFRPSEFQGLDLKSIPKWGAFGMNGRAVQARAQELISVETVTQDIFKNVVDDGSSIYCDDEFFNCSNSIVYKRVPAKQMILIVRPK